MALGKCLKGFTWVLYQRGGCEGVPLGYYSLRNGFLTRGEDVDSGRLQPIIDWEFLPAWQRQPITGSTNLSVRATIERYKKACDSSNTGSVTEANVQFYQQEASKLRRQIREIQNSNRHILGEALSTLNVKELKNLEGRLEKGISRIRSKKNEMLFAEIEYMQKREIELQNHNNFLRAKIAENDRAQQQQANMMPGTSSAYDQSMPPPQSYDRSFLPVILESNHHYNRQGQNQTPLQLV